MLKLIEGYLKTKIVTEDIHTRDNLSLTRGLPVIDQNRCRPGCQLCAAACPTGAMVEKQVAAKACIYCHRCRNACPAGAIATTSPPLISGAPELLQETLRERIKKICRKSLHIRYVDTGSCNGCDFEINSLTNPFYDIQQYGIDFVPSPRHADMLIVTGVVTRNMEIALKKTYEACPKPTLVVAVGACACGGGMFKDAYAAGGGVDQHLPVDVYIPGCPPTPALILEGILKAVNRI
ncbi:NADH-quinone oxidoreductase subunit NuoB [Desulforamulus ruminis]|uniref:NADH ubiquinone oxidoreductase 20 kDa subunit n=1 Tax=Desulforamulus ruminis (strain ATCC 23193 / DSM 2154 / NCIMB 8452 / DL) TaxID=696281 RepID=F6DVL1_DESRL|nr:NADH-quinone oxidoreductase subunit NuoB [Desulforamulus ruminis]AEG61471.1 NADH ubiquinone oxidoreductase 20 kDa subunit [Desulforamulus ruminis DSM 2154]